ncbi:Multidrug transporter EmrE [Oligella urethralis]|uniref:DMT family transporter n=1 Tax=Oligella urethralis TaxID=90245 RepID=UPI000C9C6948|nr:multidrug efflux SMR transporter [Oligella urethralis]AVL71941.1 QacE family quaternary ammonium compound efflux SMR transporter [Oligella urethralis]PMC16651.1 QacE family quaternary ammonium compound efflux SMR transporter [Oligella urethralis]WOS38689.1 Multidrug transporter EmrE [Oligella urethralis]SUA48977.1 Methyl viologen resistance protein C [Oligella urethralis]SUA52099.1 Methyl viologen resistance protein C [Oligella urethralis]
MQPTIAAYCFLAIAIFFELVGTSLLIKTEQFTRLIPSALVLISYGSSFYFLSLSLKTIPIGIAYALWSAIGIVCIAVIGFIFFKQRLDQAAILGIGLIIIGVVIINLFSKSVTHG